MNETKVSQNNIYPYFVHAMKCTLVFSILSYFVDTCHKTLNWFYNAKFGEKNIPQVYFIPKFGTNGKHN